MARADSSNTVTDTTGGAAVASNVPFQSGQTIQFDGANTVTISGTPVAGDSFTVAPSTSQSLFETVADLINALERPITATSTSTELLNRVSEALTNLSQGLDNILRVRASIGSRLTEVDAVGNVAADLNLQYEETLSRLQDADYAAAVSQLTREQTNLEAAQKSFLRVSQLSLFNFI